MLVASNKLVHCSLVYPTVRRTIGPVIAIRTRHRRGAENMLPRFLPTNDQAQEDGKTDLFLNAVGFL